MDVGKNTSLGDGGAVKKLVQLLVVADGQLDVAGDDAGLLVVASGVSGQLENLSGQVLDDGGEVDGGASSDAASIASLLEEAVDASNGELQTGLLGAGLRGGFLSGASGALSSFSRHGDWGNCECNSVRRARLNTAAARWRSKFENGATGCREKGVLDAIQLGVVALTFTFDCHSRKSVINDFVSVSTLRAE